MKLICLDVGTVRIGVAKADTTVKIAVPAGMIPVDGEELEAIARLARVYGTDFFVLGLPRNSQGLETKQSAYVRDFAESLKAKIPGAKVYFQDESLTSVEAEEQLATAGKQPKTIKEAKKLRASGKIDSAAATVILQDFLEQFASKMGEKLPKEAKKKTSKSLTKDVQKAANPHKKLKIALIAICTAILLLCGASGAAVFAYFKLLEPTDPTCGVESLETPSTCEIAHIEVPEGSSVADIATILSEAGLIKNPFVFQIFSKINGYDGKYQAGNYQISRGESVENIAKILETGPVAAVFRLTFRPGENIWDFTRTLETAGYSAEAISAALAAKYDLPVLQGLPEGASLEGYLYGETYEFYVGESVENIIQTTIRQLQQVIAENDLEAAFAAQGLSLREGIILASVVQKEAATADMPMVAQVFYNRLRIGMPLGSDVTYSYSLNLIDPERNAYDNAHIETVTECHNTRHPNNTGLPCGPISNPGLSALLAVAHPTPTEALYFLTGDDAVMYYSNTAAEHEANARAHCQVLCNISL